MVVFGFEGRGGRLDDGFILDFGVGLRAEIFVGGEERNVFPNGVADWANQSCVVSDMRGNARKMKGMRTFGSVNGRSVPRLHATQTDSAATLLIKKNTNKCN